MEDIFPLFLVKHRESDFLDKLISPVLQNLCPPDDILSCVRELLLQQFTQCWAASSQGTVLATKSSAGQNSGCVPPDFYNAFTMHGDVFIQGIPLSNEKPMTIKCWFMWLHRVSRFSPSHLYSLPQLLYSYPEFTTLTRLASIFSSSQPIIFWLQSQLKLQCWIVCSIHAPLGACANGTYVLVSPRVTRKALVFPKKKESHNMQIYMYKHTHKHTYTHLVGKQSALSQ